MRLRHELWHFVRAVWNNPGFPDEGRDILRDLGWDLPDDRAPFSDTGHLLLDNHSGEDFLFMHREMIAMTDRALAAANEPSISRWSEVPEPGDSDFPVPPVWQYKDPEQNDEDNDATTRFLESVKSDEYFEQTMQVRERFLTNPSNLRRLSLGALGNIAEMTIHNMMHMRWSTDPERYRRGINLGDPTGGDPSWDELSYDYLGDTYSSHVNPHFWYLHGWIDDLIDLWADTNRVTEIDWTGKWVGGPDLEDGDAHHGPHGTDMMMEHGRTPKIAKGAPEMGERIARLKNLSGNLTFPSTLMELAREEFRSTEDR